MAFAPPLELAIVWSCRGRAPRAGPGDLRLVVTTLSEIWAVILQITATGQLYERALRRTTFQLARQLMGDPMHHGINDVPFIATGGFFSAVEGIRQRRLWREIPNLTPVTRNAKLPYRWHPAHLHPACHVAEYLGCGGCQDSPCLSVPTTFTDDVIPSGKQHGTRAVSSQISAPAPLSSSRPPALPPPPISKSTITPTSKPWLAMERP
jgi:hypothetical protein